MSGSAARWGRHGKRWLGAGMVLAAVGIAVIVVATQSGSTKSLPVFIVVAHATVHDGALDHVEAVNRSRYQVGMTSCGIALPPRTGARFSGARGPTCGTYDPIAPHSGLYLGNPTSTPGKYWVWFAYRRRGSHVVHVAYTKLTVLGPVPKPLVLVLIHATIRVGSRDAVEAVNTGDYLAANTGCSGPGVSSRTSTHFKPHHVFCAGGAGPSVPPHSHIRIAIATSVTPTTPGKYWVWFDYFYGPGGIATTAYTKLTVLP
jgi:hypothetical protein